MRSATRSSSASRGSCRIRFGRKTILALERGGDSRDLHARFGGDEFCFLIPDLPGCAEAVDIADRFKEAVEGHDWSRDDRRLAAGPCASTSASSVCTSVRSSERRGVARKLAAELIHRADQLMYDAKTSKAAHVYPTAVRVQAGGLVELPDAVEKCAAKRKAAKKHVDLR